jgi:hypothetical protein
MAFDITTLFDMHVPQSECVADDADRRQSHGSCRNHRRQENAEKWKQHTGRDRHAGGVVDKRKEQVLPDIPHDGARELARPHDALQVAFEQRDAGASMATSVPVPIAIPTSAAANAGASFTPSPAIATTRPAF